mmetsp:Transcript_34210/g.41349  ORF Transcript_34210/g.41349 Transcript_34210/m.41349 type:complete len:171 (-) Transcript_34210:420-932(-)|eukprot:CAMPEP_0197858618 /NCGR_PEP_ID=MMETSP1438-20131217/32525_1 /TAXON_ID=1461541 /ORGANISM="Pterosperma sp., Strain CCMP1384" /LENGTH=170 /DNA_ID=CAMNT_0043474831 /DNA_START=99 /DNA_END=611 /DNA_ORIENTATION=+
MAGQLLRIILLLSIASVGVAELKLLISHAKTSNCGGAQDTVLCPDDEPFCAVTGRDPKGQWYTFAVEHANDTDAKYVIHSTRKNCNNPITSIDLTAKKTFKFRCEAGLCPIFYKFEYRKGKAVKEEPRDARERASQAELIRQDLAKVDKDISPGPPRKAKGEKETSKAEL